MFLATPEWRGGGLLRSPPAGCALTPLLCPQSLQNSSYNHFAAIYYLLLERLKELRLAQPPARPVHAWQQRPRSSDLSGFEVRGGAFDTQPQVSALDCVPKLGIPCWDMAGRACRLSPQVTYPLPLGTWQGSCVVKRGGGCQPFCWGSGPARPPPVPSRPLVPPLGR